MRSLPRLTRLFRTITSLTAISGTVAACSSRTSGGPSRDGIDENVCTNESYVASEKLTPKVPVDFLSTGRQGGTVGTMCGNAKDVKTCQEKHSALLAEAGGFQCGQGGCSILTYTRGDEVGAVRNVDQAKAFLSFTSLADAAFLAYVSGYYFECSKDNANTTAAGYELIARKGSGCGTGNDLEEARITVTKAGDLSVTENVTIAKGDSNCQIGRRPEGLRPCPTRHDDGLGRWFAETARLEAASVVAFERLADELEALGAPAELVEMALASAADEIRHARVTARLAKRYGGVVEAPCVDDVPRRSLFDIARENAVEGCVRETFGALVATFQVDHAEAADIRAAMSVIARDETKHSALAWEIAAWAEPLLSAEERADVEAARLEAAASLRRELHEEPHADVQRLAGIPKATDAITMFDAAARELWAA